MLKTLKNELVPFVKDALKWNFSGSRGYQIYLCILFALMVVGFYAYTIQLTEGLAATGMSNIVSW